MPRWKDLKRFCERDGWELYKNTDHYFFKKSLKMVKLRGQRYQEVLMKFLLDYGRKY